MFENEIRRGIIEALGGLNAKPLPLEESQMLKKATYYLAGNCFQGDADLFMFTCWNADQTTCGCHSVYGRELKANIEALTRMGYAVENLDLRRD